MSQSQSELKFSLSLPIIETHMSNEPVAMFYLPGHRIKFFKIKPRGKYFVMYNKIVKGIFEMSDDRAYYIGKTPVYHFVIDNSTSIDPVIVGEINKYCKKNRLTKIKRKDAKHSSFLNTITKRGGSKSDLEEIQKTQLKKMEEKIHDGMEEMDKQLEETNQERDDNHKVVLDEKAESVFLLEYMLNQNMLDQDEHDTLVFKIENGSLDFKGMIEELKEKSLVTINEPFDVNVQTFLEDFGGQNPVDLAGLVDDLRENKKTLKTLTATPMKSFIPASTILAIGLVAIMAVAVLGQNPDILNQIIPGGGFSLPGLNFGGFIMSLADKLF